MRNFMSMLIGFNHHVFYNSNALCCDPSEHDLYHPEECWENKKS